MKTILTMLFLSFCAISTQAQTNASDDAQIRELVKTMETGWAKKDGALFAKPFSDNSDYVVINGMRLKGRTAIAAGHQGIFDSFYKETNIKAEVQSIRYIRNDIAIVHFSSHLTGMSNGQKIDGRGQITITAARSANGEWQIESFQNTSTEQTPNGK